MRRELGSVELQGCSQGTSRAEFVSKLGTVAEEADECLDWLEYFRDARIRDNPELIEEGRALARIFATAVRTARSNVQQADLREARRALRQRS